MVDALADRGDEGRARLRKATVSCQEALTRGFPNGETRLMETSVTPKGGRTWGSETSQYPEEKKSTEIPKVAASEIGLARDYVTYQIAELPGKVSHRR